MRIQKITILLLFITFNLFSQQNITVDDIYTGAFRAKGMEELQAMKNTNQYTVLNFDKASKSQQIDLYDYATLKKVKTIIDTKTAPALSDGIDSYSFNKTETKILIANNSNQIFRRSFTADYYLYDMTTKKTTKILGQVQEPTFSPDGKKNRICTIK